MVVHVWDTASSSRLGDRSLKARTHGATLRTILRAMAKLHRVSTPEIVARIIVCNIAAVEYRSTSAKLRATNVIVKHVACNIACSVALCAWVLRYPGCEIMGHHCILDVPSMAVLN